MPIKVADFQQLYTKMHRIAEDAPVATAFGQYEGMQNIMLDAKARAPRDTDTMADSGYVTPPEVRQGMDAIVEAGFGGNSSEYVVRQHEDTSLRHPRGGEAKFFSNALDAGREQLSETIKRHLKEFILTGRTRPPQKLVPATPYEQARNNYLPGSSTPREELP